MSGSHEVLSELKHWRSVVFENAWKRYEFEGKHGPIIGITGVGGGWSRKVREYLTTNDINGVLTYFDFINKSIDKYLPQLDEEVKKYPNALILGFSAGGFIALRYAQEYGWNKFQKIYTIATPFGGIPQNLSILGGISKDLSYGSSFLKNILDITPPEGEDKVLSFLSHEDRFTANPYKTRGNLNWPCAILEGKSHGSLQASWNGIAPFLDMELKIPSKE